MAILEKHDYEHVDELVKNFNSTLDELSKDESLEPWEAISAAIGYALYDPAKDSTVANVFKRADTAMYERKKAMKAIRA